MVGCMKKAVILGLCLLLVCLGFIGIFAEIVLAKKCSFSFIVSGVFFICFFIALLFKRPRNWVEKHFKKKEPGA